VLRSTWNYYLSPRRFLDWIEVTDQETRLLNPAEVIRWNHHKRYLAAMEARGIPIVPTVWVNRRDFVPLDQIMDEQGWSDVVVKPSVSAGSYCTHRWQRGNVECHAAYFAELAGRHDLMVQPYRPSVEIHGERSIIWIDGEFTHAVRKSPRLNGDVESVSEALPISSAERAFGERTLAGLTHNLLYARVDIMLGEGAELQLSELELIEPSLFLLQHPPALDRLVRAIVNR
jgi:hypothetical protein